MLRNNDFYHFSLQTTQKETTKKRKSMCEERPPNDDEYPLSCPTGDALQQRQDMPTGADDDDDVLLDTSLRSNITEAPRNDKYSPSSSDALQRHHHNQDTSMSNMEDLDDDQARPSRALKSTENYLYRVPRFTVNKSPSRLVNLTEPPSQPKKKRARVSKHIRSKAMIDGSGGDWDTIMKNLKRDHLRIRNLAVSQFHPILEDVLDGSIIVDSCVFSLQPHLQVSFPETTSNGQEQRDHEADDVLESELQTETSE